MSVERLNEIKRQIGELTLEEKQDLLAFLIGQIDKEKDALAGKRDLSDEQQEEPGT
ncbi:MAG: hypothetical protein ABI977_11465 [Acidobacteriota bacterium]